MSFRAVIEPVERSSPGTGNGHFGQILIFIFFLASYLYAIKYYPFSFNFEPDYFGNYYIVLGAVITFMLFSCCMIFDKIIVSKGIIIALIILAYCQIILFTRTHLANEHACIILMAAVFLFFFQRLEINSIDLICIILALVYCYELFYLFQQWVSVRQFPNRALLITGTLHNSGIFACYIVIHFPLVKYLIKKIKLRFVFFSSLYCLLVFVTAFTLYVCQSRTAIIAFVCLFARSVYKAPLLKTDRRALFYKIGPILLLVFFAGLFLYSIFLQKQASSVGRSLVLNVSLAHLHENMWMGIGNGNFSASYPRWQMDHFKTVKNPPISYFLSAGPTYLLFNEYLQFIIENGVIIFLCCAWMGYRFFKLVSTRLNEMLSMFKEVVIMILLCSAFSYPLHCVPIIIVFTFCLAAGYAVADSSSLTRISLSKKISIGLFMLVNLIFLINIKPLVRQVMAVHTLSGFSTQNYSTSELKEKFVNLSYTLADDNKFLMTYAAFLIDDVQDYKKAIVVLNYCLSLQITDDAYDLLGRAYERDGNYSMAIQVYRQLSYLIPSRFSPHYRIFQLLQQSHQDNESLDEAKLILKMPVKIHTQDVDLIRNEMRIYILKKQIR